MKRKRKSAKETDETEVKKELSLTDKYRPKSIDELYGNAVLKKTIKSAIENNDIPHAILLSGPFGSGKTTIARILTKELNCSEFDYKEIDIADFTGVDLVREVRRKMNTAPMQGKVKVYVFDEGHKMSEAAQQATLKMLEEPPKHCYFMICTTDPQKLLPTIRSRCINYIVQTLSEKQIFKLISGIAEKEDIDLPKKVALQISRDSLGHPRNAIKILDKIRNLDTEDMLEAAMHQAEQEEQVIMLCRGIMNRKPWKELATILKGLKEEPESIRRAIRGYFSTLLLSGDESAFFVLDTLNSPYYNTDGRASLIRDVFEIHKDLQ